MQVTDCYSEPHMFIEVSDLPWTILSFNACALKTTGEPCILQQMRLLRCKSYVFEMNNGLLGCCG